MKNTKRESDRQVQEMKAPADRRRVEEFYVLAKRFRSASDPAEARRLGHRLGRLLFGK